MEINKLKRFRGSKIIFKVTDEYGQKIADIDKALDTNSKRDVDSIWAKLGYTQRRKND